MATAFLLAALLATGVSAGEIVLDGIEVYGSKRLTGGDAEARYGKAIKDFIRLKSRGSKAADRASEDLRRRTEAEVKSDWEFAWARLSYSDYYADGVHKAFISIDVVEPADRAARLAFRKPPARSLSDPGGLLADWGRYVDLGWRLFKQGQLSVSHDACLSFFCEWGAQTPELRAYEEKFVAGAKEHKQELFGVLRGEKDPAKRAIAAYLISYIPDAGEAAKTLADALDDPEVEVRSAALRVYADYAVHHKEVFLPITRLQAALDFPSSEDRNKAMGVIAGMASNPMHRRFLILKAGDAMLRLMQSRQPSISDTAYAAVGILSNEGFDRRDAPSWQRWLVRAKAQEESKPEPSVMK